MILNEPFIYILKVIIGSDSHIPPIWHSCSEFKKKQNKTQHISSISYHSKQKESQVLRAAIRCQNTSGDFFFLTSLNCSYSTIVTHAVFLRSSKMLTSRRGPLSSGGRVKKWGKIKSCWEPKQTQEKWPCNYICYIPKFGRLHLSHCNCW